MLPGGDRCNHGVGAELQQAYKQQRKKKNQLERQQHILFVIAYIVARHEVKRKCSVSLHVQKPTGTDWQFYAG